MSALWTPCRAGVSPGFLVVEPGAVAVWNHRHNYLRPSVVCRAQPRHLGAHHRGNGAEGFHWHPAPATRGPIVAAAVLPPNG